MRKYFASLMFTGSALLSITAGASTSLPPGSAVPVPGATSAAEIDLAGGVILDRLIPFKIVNPGGVVLFRGTLQNRIVRSTATGNLHFYYRIRDTAAGLPGKIAALTTRNFRASPNLATSYRIDGLGTVPPTSASRSADGAQIIFRFGPQAGATLNAGDSSKFFELKTTAKRYNPYGTTRISLLSGHSVILRTAQPQAY